jgi:hypothetical protein
MVVPPGERPGALLRIGRECPSWCWRTALSRSDLSGDRQPYNITSKFIVLMSRIGVVLQGEDDIIVAIHDVGTARGSRSLRRLDNTMLNQSALPTRAFGNGAGVDGRPIYKL